MEWLVKTDVGVLREENQDMAAVFEKDNIVLSVLCDGMGGHEGGSYASKLTVETIEKVFSNTPPTKPEKLFVWFKNVLIKSKKVMEKAAKHNRSLLDMGTTITVAIIYPDKNIYIFNVGDSRTYIYNDLLHQVTIDHNLRNYYINEEGLSAEKAANIVGGSALTSALGPKKTTRIDAFNVSADSEAKYLIQTSDGIHDYITKPQFETIISSNIILDKICEKLISKSIKMQSTDNLTISILKVVK